MSAIKLIGHIEVFLNENYLVKYLIHNFKIQKLY